MTPPEASTCHISKLPNELFILIFRYLVIPYQIEPHELTLPEWHTTASIQAEHGHREVQKGMFSGQAPCFVCKAWYTLQVPLLCEWITIYRNKNLKQLLKILRCRQVRKRSTYLDNAGRYTKRLDIAFKDDEALLKGAFNILMEIIRQLPNLEVSVIKTVYPLYRDDMDHHIFDAISPKLKVISWVDIHGQLPEVNLYTFLKSHPNLVAINLPSRIDHRKPPNADSVLCQSLEHICVYTHDRHDDSKDLCLFGPFPSLKRLSLVEHWQPISRELVRPLAQSKATLTSVQLNLSYLSGLGSVAWPQPLFNNSPLLQRLDLVIAEWPWSKPVRTQWHYPSSVSEISVRVIKPYLPSGRAILWFFIQLTYITTRKEERPVVVQFLDEFNIQQVMARCGVLIPNRHWLLTSWKSPSGEMFDLLALEDTVEELQQRARSNVMDMTSWLENFGSDF